MKNIPFSPDDRMAFLDCLANPGCDPAEEYIAVEILGGNFEIVFNYASEDGTRPFSAALLDAQGGVISRSVPFNEYMQSHPPTNRNALGKLCYHTQIARIFPE